LAIVSTTSIQQPQKRGSNRSPSGGIRSNKHDAIDVGKIHQEAADEWLSTWIGEISYCVPCRTVLQHQ